MLDETLNRMSRDDATEVAYFVMRVLRYRRVLPTTTREYLIGKGTSPPPESISSPVKSLLDEIEQREGKSIGELDDKTAEGYAQTLTQITQRRAFAELHCKPAEASSLLQDLRTYYERPFTPLGVVAIREGQRRVHAPEHETWGTVTCEMCGAQFLVGPNRIYGFRGNQEEFIRKLEEILQEDHSTNRPHLDAYELGG